MLFSEILQKIENAPELDFGLILNESIELFKKVWVQGLLMTLLTFACALPAMAIIFIPLSVMGLADASSPQTFENIQPMASVLLFSAYFIGMLILMIVSFGIQASFFRIVAAKDLSLNDTEDYFHFLKKPFLPKTLQLALAIFGISIIATLLCLLPMIYAIVPLSYIAVIYAFNPELSVSNIIKASFDLGNKKWMISFGLIIVAGLLAQMVGLLLCFIGLFITSAFSMMPLYIVYKKVIAFGSSEVETIGTDSI